MHTPDTIHMSTANIITLSRLPLLLLVVALLYMPWTWALFTAMGLLPLLYLMDWFDGYVARHKDEVTDLGSVLDISIDRVVENVLWLVFAHQGKVPVFIPVLFIIRSFVVDGLRSYALSRGYSAFGMMQSPWGRFLVAGRFLRALYGLAKGGAFCALALTSALAAMGDQAPPELAWVPAAELILVYLSVTLCVARGIPVLLDIRRLLVMAPIKPGANPSDPA
ncbi:MAG: CDP-alcohol phosphatidyltransferase family protein [Desulfarculaceae bacterium]|jgi:CDP-diacylglycerol--glycerol-3-phosphate 3-phosphatidyltransferase